MRKNIFTLFMVFIPSLLLFGQNSNEIRSNALDSIAFHQSLIDEGRTIEKGNAKSAVPFSAVPFAAEDIYKGSFFVGGDASTYYPVIFKDGQWSNNKPTVIELGRSNVHMDSSWNGSLMAIFKFHVTQWGNGSRFVDVDIKQKVGNTYTKPFIGSWTDGTIDNGTLSVIIWLRGQATYYYHSNYMQTPAVTLGSIKIKDTDYSPKTTIDSYVNSNGMSYANSIWMNGDTPNYIAHRLGIGTTTPQAKLDVRGKIIADEVEIKVNTGADFVFAEDYALKPLAEVAEFVKENKHLPEIPSEKEMQENGLNINEFQIKLLQKIEELTLYVIEQQKEIDKLKNQLKNID